MARRLVAHFGADTLAVVEKSPHRLREIPGIGDAKADAIDVLLFDRAAWALIRAAEPPQGYEGMTATAPPDGMYIDTHGRAVFVVDQHTVPGPEEVLATLGETAQEVLERVKDPVTALERLGRTY